MGMYDRRDFLQWLALAGLSGLAAHGTDVTVLSGVTLIDGTGTPAKRDMTLVLSGDRIAWIGRRPGLPHTMRGKFVIPGLWDMHTHYGFDDRIVVPLHVANGVTSIREMWGFPQIHDVRDRIEAGQLLGPRMTIASSLIDGPPSVWAPDATEVQTAAQARAAVRLAAASRADFLKIYSYLGREAFDALVDEARAVGLPVAGHHPARLRLREVSDAGMRSFEHLYGMPTATSTVEDQIQRQLNDTPVDPANPGQYYALMRELERQASLRHSRSKAAALYERLARNGSWQSPTLTVNRALSVPADTFANDPRLKYIDATTKLVWEAIVAGVAPRTPEQIAQQRAYLRFRLDMVGAMDRAGVPILGGSDTPNPYVFPGFAAHDELELLVRAGLSPMRALQTMTRDAARYLGLARRMGTVEAGKVADLLVLDADPLDDIRNTQRIHAIVARGRLVTAAQRAQILADVERAAAVTIAAPSVAPRRLCACHS